MRERRTREELDELGGGEEGRGDVKGRGGGEGDNKIDLTSQPTKSIIDWIPPRYLLYSSFK